MDDHDALVVAYRELHENYTELLRELERLRGEVAETKREFHRLQAIDAAQRAEREWGAAPMRHGVLR
jgi:hypothetical protein